MVGKGSKHDLLGMEEVASRKIAKLVIERIEYLSNHFDKPLNEIQILDWGCGRGRTVGRLHQLGYHAIGVDIDERVLMKAEEAFNKMGLQREKILTKIKTNNRTEISRHSLHLIIAEHVFEHVRSPEAMLKEMNRILKNGGMVYTVFPSSRRIVEPHLRMPLVHWLPKGFLRKAAIRMCVLFRIVPNWPIERGSSEYQTYSNYSHQKTYYMNLRKWEALFSKCGFSTKTITGGHPTVQKLMRRMPFRLLPRNIFVYLINKFWLVHLIATKVKESNHGEPF